MATWSIKISGALGSATFDPNPLPAAANDLVSWANETDDPHQLAVEGSPITNPIAPWSSSSSSLFPPPAGTETGVTYTCLNHQGERGTITFTALLVALLLSFVGTAARAQTIPCADILNKELVPIPEIRRGDDGVLRGTLVTIGQKQLIASVKGKNRVAGPLGPENVDCAPQWVGTYIAGRDPLPSQGAHVP